MKDDVGVGVIALIYSRTVKNISTLFGTFLFLYIFSSPWPRRCQHFLVFARSKNHFSCPSVAAVTIKANREPTAGANSFWPPFQHFSPIPRSAFSVAVFLFPLSGKEENFHHQTKGIFPVAAFV